MGINPRPINESAKFTRNIIWVALSQVITSALSIFILPALTKSYSQASYGIWTQVNVTTGLLAPALTLQFGSAVARFLAGEQNKNKRLHSLGSMFNAILIVSTIAFISLIIFATQISNFLFGSPAYVHFVVLTFLWTFADALFAFFASYLRARQPPSMFIFIPYDCYRCHGSKRIWIRVDFNLDCSY
jgi:O-antigen/teichoic acid export membrane protein